MPRTTDKETVMVAGIEVIEGTTGSFLSAREDAWHRLGTVVDTSFTAEDAMEKAYLGKWDVRKLPLFAEERVGGRFGVRVDAKGRYATVRTNPVTGVTEYIGDVGSDYTVIQNEEHAEFLNTLVDESGAHFETAGSLFDGKRVFISMKLPQSVVVGGDVTDAYLIALNSHDGSKAFQVCVSMIRPVCHNTVTAAFGSAKHTFSIRHTRNAKGRIQDAREALGMTFRYIEEFQAQAEALQELSFTDAEFDAFLAELYGAKADETSTRMQNILGNVKNLWTSSPTLENTKGTRYGAFQAVTEFTTHFAGAHGGSTEIRSINRAQRDVFDDKLRTKAFQLLSV